MMDDELIGYLLDLLDADDRTVVEACLAADPETAARALRIRNSLAPLTCDRGLPEPRPGLAVRTVSRLAGHLLEQGLFHDQQNTAPPDSAETPALPSSRLHHHDSPELRVLGGRFRLDWIVAGAIVLVAGGLVLSGVSRIRYEREMMACQNNLRTLHAGLSGYAEFHGGRFPKISDEKYPTAEFFVRALDDAGQLTPGISSYACPGRNRAPTDGPYSYTLGYREPSGELAGLTTHSGEFAGALPIAADCPIAVAAPCAGPISPHQREMNVLFVDGRVQRVHTACVGVNSDDIYRNRNNQVAAGVDPTDTVLGRVGDRP